MPCVATDLCQKGRILMMTSKTAEAQNFTRGLFFVGAFVGSLVAGSDARAVSFAVTDSDFVGGVYEFRFLNDPTSRTLVNGVNQGVANPTLTNSGWVCCGTNPGVRYWQAVAGGGGLTALTAGALTMGWDFSGVTGQIAKVELNPRHFLFQFNPWNAHAVGDQIAGFLSTPAAFGAGAYTELYRYTGTAGNQITVGADTLTDYAGTIGTAWLNNPAFLEFMFAYSQTPSPTIPSAHLQIFRDNAGTNGFMLRVTLAETSEVPLPAAWIGFLSALVGAGAYLRRRQKAADV